MTKSNTKVEPKVEPATVTTTEQTIPTEFQGKTPDELRAQYGSWSAVMRAMKAKNMSTGSIAKALGKKFQHVRNVLITPVGKQTAQS